MCDQLIHLGDEIQADGNDEEAQYLVQKVAVRPDDRTIVQSLLHRIVPLTQSLLVQVTLPQDNEALLEVAREEWQ